MQYSSSRTHVIHCFYLPPARPPVYEWACDMKWGTARQQHFTAHVTPPTHVSSLPPLDKSGYCSKTLIHSHSQALTTIWHWHALLFTWYYTKIVIYELDSTACPWWAVRTPSRYAKSMVEAKSLCKYQRNIRHLKICIG